VFGGHRGSCINAIRFVKTAMPIPSVRTDILDRVTTGHWKERMSDGGYHGRRGLPLPLLGQVVKDSISALPAEGSGSGHRPDTQNQPPGIGPSENAEKTLRDFDRHGSGLIIAHFDQGPWSHLEYPPHIARGRL
jgi:hypothetical protein